MSNFVSKKYIHIHVRMSSHLPSLTILIITGMTADHVSRSADFSFLLNKGHSFDSEHFVFFLGCVCLHSDLLCVRTAGEVLKQ